MLARRAIATGWAEVVTGSGAENCELATGFSEGAAALREGSLVELEEVAVGVFLNANFFFGAKADRIL